MSVTRKFYQRDENGYSIIDLGCAAENVTHNGEVLSTKLNLYDANIESMGEQVYTTLPNTITTVENSISVSLRNIVGVEEKIATSAEVSGAQEINLGEEDYVKYEMNTSFTLKDSTKIAGDTYHLQPVIFRKAGNHIITFDYIKNSIKYSVQYVAKLEDKTITIDNFSHMQMDASAGTLKYEIGVPADLTFNIVSMYGYKTASYERLEEEAEEESA